MRHGLRLLGTFVAVLAAAPTAHAYVYWSVSGNSDGTTLGRADLDGSGVNHSFVTGTKGPEGIVVYGSHVYWTNTQTNSIGRANLNGTGANASFIPNATHAFSGTPLPFGLATDGTY